MGALKMHKMLGSVGENDEVSANFEGISKIFEQAMQEWLQLLDSGGRGRRPLMWRV